MSSPVVLVLDDVHTLHNQECRAALSVLADHVPGGSRLVLAGRSQPPLRMARLRAEGRILEIGAGDLSLTRAEASSLLRNVALTLAEDDVAELHQRTEGWPTGLYLAALYLREGGPWASAAVSFGGDDRRVSEYMESEFLARIPPQQRAFLTRTAVLERMSGSLCEAVLDLPGSGATLADLARSNLLLVPLDRREEWYRYHHLFRDTLLAELRRARIEECYVTPLVCAVQARTAMHRGDVPAARQQLISAQRLRYLLTYAIPHLAVQARMELIRVHLALADPAGARTLMREIDELLRRRPGLGNLVGDAQVLRARLANERDTSAPGASALTGAELRLLPLLSTHLSFPEIAGELFLSRNTIKSQAYSIYRKLGASSRSQAVARSRELGLLICNGPVKLLQVAGWLIT
jgi:ATP/maltotriose-dependent transcriptional regulator MalT